MAPRKLKEDDIWNERLVKSLQARADQKRQQGSPQFVGFQQAADKIKAVRKDIYAFKTGRVVNLPQQGLSKSIYDLCQKIIAGQEPELPPGYVATLPEDAHSNNPFETHPYLTKMKVRGGAFAILMAFHLSQRTTMTKDQIIEAGQRFCDEQMEDNFHAGRMYGAWKANATLKRHGLIHVNSTVAYREGRGLRAQGKFTYELTRDGERFIEALLDRHPGIRREAESARGTAIAVGAAVPSFGERAHVVFPKQGGTVFAKKHSAAKRGRLSEHSRKDREELRAWVITAGIGNQKLFKVGKDRRKKLHDACDELNMELAKSGRYLKHESINATERSRPLYVTMMSGAAASTPGLASEPLLFGSANSVFSSFMPSAHRESGAQPVALFADAGHKLGGGASPPKRARKLPPSAAAAKAAMLRLSAQQKSRQVSVSSTKTQQRLLSQSTATSILSDDDDSFGDRKMPARPKTKSLNNDNVIELLDSDNEEDKAVTKVSLKAPPLGCADSSSSKIVDLTGSVEPKNLHQSREQPPDKPVLTIFIDDRERNRNATPRYLRTELGRLVTSDMFLRTRNAFVSTVGVLEKSLKVGDIAFSLDGNNFLPPLIERKTIGDLVSRSFRKDHWFQLHRMRDSVSSDDVCFFLLEGDFRCAVQYTAHGAQQLEAYGPENHTIDNEESLIRFIGRAILSTNKVRFLQTKEVQGSLRAIGAIGLVAASRPTNRSVTTATTATDKKALADFLIRSGVPWQIASCLADEMGSKRQLELLYRSIHDVSCQMQVLTPILDACTKKSGIPKGTAVGWSRAIYKACHSVVPSDATVKSRFENLSNLVEDQALLLESLHSYPSGEEALNHVYDSVQMQDDVLRRRVHIDLPAVLGKCFPDHGNGNSVFLVTTYDSKDEIPCVTMRTHAGSYKSAKLALFVIDGSELVSQLRRTIGDIQEVPTSALSVAASIRSDCCASQHFAPTVDSCVLIIRGLGPATNKWAKAVGYQSEFRVAIDLVLSALSINHGTVVLQAVRLSEDLEIMLQQFAVSCYNHQFLTHN